MLYRLEVPEGMFVFRPFDVRLADLLARADHLGELILDQPFGALVAGIKGGQVQPDLHILTFPIGTLVHFFPKLSRAGNGDGLEYFRNEDRTPDHALFQEPDYLTTITRGSSAGPQGYNFKIRQL